MTKSGPEVPSITEQDLAFLRQAIDLARAARAHGAHPFGCVIVDESGQVLVTARNNAVPPKGDPTQHAERLAAAHTPALLHRALALVEDTREALALNVTEELALEALAYRLERRLAR